MTVAVTAIAKPTLYVELVASGSHAATTVDVSSASGQPILSVASTTGFEAGRLVVIDATSVGGGIETLEILSIQAGVSLTMTTNLVNTHGIGDECAMKWYYIVFYIDSATPTSKTAQSPWSDEVGVQFDTTNKEAVLFVDPSATNATTAMIGRTDVSGDYDRNDTANFHYQKSGGGSFTTVLGGLGDTTVDADSAAAGSTLNVASTTGFAINDYIIIDPGGAKQEVQRISSISAGVSFTLVGTLTNTHLGADAAEVWEDMQRDDFIV